MIEQAKMQGLERFLHNNTLLPLLKSIGKLADEQQVDVYLVGGFVRDLFLNRPSKDADLLVVGDGVEFAKKVANEYPKAQFSYFKNYGTANLKLQIDGEVFEIEFVGARKESYSRDSRNPIVEDGTLEDDLKRRDFTINALAISLNQSTFGQLIDQFNGLEHLNDKTIITPLDANTTFSDDPLRMLRAVRFASQLGFTISKDSLNALKTNAYRIEIISQERITDELNKIILSPIPSIGFKILYDVGILQIIFPELCDLQGVETKNGISHKDNFYHTLQVLDNLSLNSDNLWLRWSAILHDIGKPASKRFFNDVGWTFHGHEVIGAKMTKTIFAKMKLPLNEKMKYVEKLVNLHLRPIALMNEVTDSAIRRLIVDAGDDIEDLFLLCKADITSKNETKVKRIIKGFESVELKVRAVEERDNLRNWKPPITGEDIMKSFGIKPSKEVGMIKHEIREAILNGEVANNKEAAFVFMKTVGQKMGLQFIESEL